MEQHPLYATFQEYKKMLEAGKVLEAFEKFYGENVVMQENTDEPMVGFAANLEREHAMWDNVTDIREIKVLSEAYGDNVVMSVWHNDFEHKEWGPIDGTQVAVQTWENGKIVKEQFFHK